MKDLLDLREKREKKPKGCLVSSTCCRAGQAVVEMHRLYTRTGCIHVVYMHRLYAQVVYTGKTIGT